MAIEKRDWKGLRWGYDEIIVSPFDSSSCEYCLTVPQVEAILAFTEFLGWSTRWESISGGDIDKTLITAFMQDLRSRLMSSCCDDHEVIRHRINPDTGILELSFDDGVTWQTDPDDPRITGVELPPPVDTGLSGNKCDAAGSINVGYSSLITHLIAAKSDSATDAEQGAIIAATLTALFGGAVPAAIVIIFGAVISWLLSADASAMSAAFDSTTFSQILCCLYCNIGDNGQFDDVGFTALLAQLSTDLTDAYAKTATIGLFSNLGVLGLNNWAASYYSGGVDCSDCDCVSLCNDVEHWSLVPLAGGAIVGLQESGYLRYTSTLSTNFPTTQTIWIQSPAADQCCKVLDAIFTRGGVSYSPFLIMRGGCNEALIYDNLGHGTADCMNQYYVEEHPGDSGAVFTMDILFAEAECP